MTRITVVIEDHAEGVHIGQQLAGGRVVSVQQGDHSELLEALEGLIAYLALDQMEDSEPEVIAKAAIAKAHGQ